MRITKQQLEALKTDLKRIDEEEIPALEKSMRKAKAPHVKGSGLD
jgi:hypothetical protein